MPTVFPLRTYQELLRLADNTEVQEGIPVSNEVDELLADYTALIAQHRKSTHDDRAERAAQYSAKMRRD